jgi:large subunit ribosomal protein L24
MAIKEKEKKPLHLTKMNIHKGDTVLITTGKDKGKRGTVSRAMPQVNECAPLRRRFSRRPSLGLEE